MKKYIDDARVHDGHRSRMRDKLSMHGQHIFDTYELLEMLLYYTIPYRDTNPLAKNLLYAFGGLDGVLSADVQELSQVCGVGEKTAEFLCCVGGLKDIIGAEMFNENNSRFYDYESVGSYLVEYFAGVEGKQVVALFFDSSMHLIMHKKIYDLEYESGGVKAKPFIDEALRNHASVVVTAHNHPFGPFYPTPGDRETNKVITEALHLTGIVHAEHYIICGDCFAGLGSLNSFSSQLSQMPAVSSFINTANARDGSLSRVESFTDKNTKNILPTNSDRDFFAALMGFCTEKNVESLTDLLLSKYHTIENTVNAPVNELVSLTNERTGLYIKLLAFITSRRSTDGLSFGKVYSSAVIAEYLKALFLGESVEKTYLISFDRDDRLLGVNLLGEGTVNASEVVPRKAIEIAIDMRASSVSLAHNHPFGRLQPSVDDVNFTKTIQALFRTCEIGFKEHFIVAGQLCDTIDF